MTHVKTEESHSPGGKKDANYKDCLPNHLLKVNRKSRQLPEYAQTSYFRARKSKRSASNLQFNSILKFTGKQKIRKGFERGNSLRTRRKLKLAHQIKAFKRLSILGLP